MGLPKISIRHRCFAAKKEEFLLHQIISAVPEPAGLCQERGQERGQEMPLIRCGMLGPGWAFPAAFPSPFPGDGRSFGQGGSRSFFGASRPRGGLHNTAASLPSDKAERA